MEPKCYKCGKAYMHKEKISGYGYVCTCPKCGHIYGPMMMTCAYCNNKITIKNENLEKLKNSPK